MPSSRLSKMLLEDTKMKSKFKLQFIVCEEDWDTFEMLRKNHFHETSKQKMLYNIFKRWLDRNAAAVEER